MNDNTYLFGKKEIHDEIGSRVFSFVQPNSPNDFLMLKTYASSGKTTTALRVLQELGLSWIYLAPEHKNVNEITNELELLGVITPEDFVHLQSRRILCEIEDYRKIAEKGVDIKPICENSCPLRKTSCPYYKRRGELMKNPKSWAGVHHHITSFLPLFFRMKKGKNSLISYFDVIIVDENPIGAFLDTKKATEKSLFTLIETIKKLELEEEKSKKVVEFLKFLRADLWSEETNYDEMYELFKKADFSNFYDYFQENLVEAYRTERMKVEERSPTYLSYLEIFAEMKKRADKNNFQFMITKIYNKRWRRGRYNFAVFKQSPFPDCHLKIIGLDGTANLEIWETLIGKKPSVLERRYEYKNLYQLKSREEARYPKTSWIRFGKITSTGKKLCRLIDLVCKAKKNKVIVVATYPVWKHIRKNIEEKKKIVFCKFYSLRSKNEFYEKADTLIITHEPNIQPFNIECYSKLSGWDEDIWRQYYTHEEIVQAVARIREGIKETITKRKRKKIEIFIFPFVKYPDGTPLFLEAKLKTEGELIDYLTKGKFSAKVDYKKKIRRLLKKNDFIYRKDVPKKIELTREKTKWLLNEMVLDGEIRDRGRKGLSKGENFGKAPKKEK